MNNDERSGTKLFSPSYLKYKTVTRLKGITNATKVEHIIKYKGALAFSFQGTAHQADVGISSFVYSLVK